MTLLLAVGLLAGCKKDTPTPPDPIVVPPVVTTTPTPPQYGTPFTAVPNREDAVIYQVNMRAFSAGGKLAGVTARLDSIKNLGVNVVYLMPIYPVGATVTYPSGPAAGTHNSANSPYAVQDYRAVGPEFGTLADLRALVEAAHARNLTVLLDWVPNHTAWDHAWVTAHPDWYLQNAAGAIQSPPDTTFTDVAQVNFNNANMRAELISAMKSWVFTANVDGFRCDYADAPGIAATNFWKQAVDTLRAVKTHKLLLLAEGSNSANFTAGFDYNFGFNFYGGIYNVYRNNYAATTFDGLNTSEYVGAAGTQQVVRYTTNHDVNGSDGTPATLFGGDAGAMSAFVIAALYKGVPMVYNGQEVGMTTAITFPFTSVKVNWNAHPEVTYAYRQLLKARAASPALRHGTPTAYSTANVCAFTKTAGTAQAFVLANVRNTATTYPVPVALAGTTWTNALTGAVTTVGTTVALPAYGYLVLKK